MQTYWLEKGPHDRSDDQDVPVFDNEQEISEEENVSEHDQHA